MGKEPPNSSAQASTPPSTERVTAYTAPLLQLSAPGGITGTTPANTILSAGATSSITAGVAINFAIQSGYYTIVRAGVSMFTAGQIAHPDSPNQERGIAMHAASGKVSTQSQSGKTLLTADKDVAVASTTGAVQVSAKTHILLTAGGSGIRIEGGNITITGPGVEFRASAKELAGPGSASPTLPAMPQPGQLHNHIELNYHYASLEPVSGAPFKVSFADGTSRTGTLDARGHATLVAVPSGEYHVEYGEEKAAWQAQPSVPDAALQRARQQQQQAHAALEAERTRGAA